MTTQHNENNNTMRNRLQDLITILQFEICDLDIRDTAKLREYLNEGFGLDLTESEIKEQLNTPELLEEEEAHLAHKYLI